MVPGGWWFRQEAGLGPLTAWIDAETRRSPNQRWGVWGGIVGGTGGIAGGLTGVLGGVLHITPSHPVFYLPLAAWGIFAIGMTAWVVRKNRNDSSAWVEAKSLMVQLMAARWHGRLHETLGDPGAALMNEGARLHQQCCQTLDSPAWKAAAGSETWSGMRHKAVAAMDAAMARLLLAVMSDAGGTAAQEVLDDMAALTEEVSLAAKRHVQTSGAALSGSDSLRETLAELRELGEAEEEFLRDHS